MMRPTCLTRRARAVAVLAVMLGLGGCTSWGEAAEALLKTGVSYCERNAHACGPGSSNPYDGDPRA